MKNALFALSLLGSIGLAASASAADLSAPVVPVLVPPPVLVAPFAPLTDREPPVVLQLGPTTTYSTIICSNFVKLPDGSWRSIAPVPFGLGFVQGIVLTPARVIVVGGLIFNNIDLASQLNYQCGSAVVTARY